VMNQSSSGKYQQLFPRDETGADNHVVAAKDYHVPATSAAFRITGPPGYEILYWLITPAMITAASPRTPPPAGTAAPSTLLPRCDDSILRARGDCIDASAGPRLVPRSAELPQNLLGAHPGGGNLTFQRQQDTAVITSTAPMAGPVVYEFHLAHR